MIVFEFGHEGKGAGWRRSLFVLSAVLVLLVAASAVAGEITVLTPMQDSVIYARRPVTHLVVKVANAVDVQRLQLEGDGDVPIKPTGVWGYKEEQYAHFTLGLKSGRNKFVLNPGGQVIKVSYRPLRTLINIDFEAPTVYRFHRKGAIPSVCGQCHSADLPADSGLDAGQQKLWYGDFAFSPECYSCHRSKASGSKWQHGPAANVLCNICHKDQAKGGQISIPGGKPADNCFKCHV